MKKILAVLVVLTLLAVPMFALANNWSDPGSISDSANEFLTYKEAVTLAPEGSTDTVVDGGDVIPAAGLVVSGLVAVLATLGCAVLPKK